MKVLIDTCVVIDALQNRKPFNEDAEAVFLSVANRKCAGFITAKASTDIYYMMHRAFHSVNKTKNALEIIFALFEIIDTSGMDCRKALASEITDYEDAVMVESAVRSGIDCIITRNLKHFAGSPLSVYSPGEFLKLIYGNDV